MLTLGIDLQDGFKDDTVLIRVNRKKVFRKKRITTNLLLGYAASVRTEVGKGTVSIEIRVETRKMAETFPLDVSANTYLGISVTDSGINYTIFPRPFGYA